MTLPAKPRKPTSFRLTRYPKGLKSRSIREYTMRIGEVIWVWNGLHEALQQLFIYIATPHNLSLGLAIWHAAKSDAAQRDLLRAAALQLTPGQVRVLQDILWLLDAVAKLAPHRNDLAHVLTQVNWTESAYVAPSYFAKPNQRKRIKEISNLRQFHRQLRDDLNVLANYADTIWWEIRYPGKYTRPPAPPKLLSINGPTLRQARD